MLNRDMIIQRLSQLATHSIFSQNYIDALDAAVSLLKSDPAEPEIVKRKYGTEYNCGACHSILMFELPDEEINKQLFADSKRFCSHCGKEIDWCKVLQNVV